MTERLPILITPRWVSVPAQPIAIQDLLRYLIAALDHPIEGSRIYEIGGADQVSYGDLMREYARQRGLRRLIIRVPVLTPRLSSLWLGLVTPLYARVGRKLIESIRHPTIVCDDTARRDFAIEPIGHRDAIAAAIREEDEELVTTRWSDALSAAGTLGREDAGPADRCFVDSRVADVAFPPAQAFGPIRRIGGATGWYYGNWLWRLRGAIDLFLGGVGMRRGRRNADSLRVGDTVDCWRVEAFEPDRRLLLRAEMKLPGRAWLEFAAEPTPTGSRIRQTAIYEPAGLLGRVYWYLVYPLHQLVFAGMLRGIVNAGRGTAATRSRGEIARRGHARPAPTGPNAEALLLLLRQWIPRPVHDVFAFFAEANKPGSDCTPLTAMGLLDPVTESIACDGPIVYSLRLAPVSCGRWVTEIRRASA